MSGPGKENLAFWLEYANLFTKELAQGGISVNIHESTENYLEAILKLRESPGVVRSIDIVRELGLSKPNISVAMRTLRGNGYIQMDDDVPLKAAQ